MLFGYNQDFFSYVLLRAYLRRSLFCNYFIKLLVMFLLPIIIRLYVFIILPMSLSQQVDVSLFRSHRRGCDARSSGGYASVPACFPDVYSGWHSYIGQLLQAEWRWVGDFSSHKCATCGITLWWCGLSLLTSHNKCCNLYLNMSGSLCSAHPCAVI